MGSHHEGPASWSRWGGALPTRLVGVARRTRSRLPLLLWWWSVAIMLGAPAARAQLLADDAPALPDHVPSVDAMAPAGWTIEQQRRADLNGDGRRDVLVVLRRSLEPAAGAASSPAASVATRESRSPQRVVAIFTGMRGGYALSALNTRLVPQVDRDSQEDPLADAEFIARRGGFDIRLNLLAGTGSYQSAALRYRFRYRDGCFRLTRYDRFETHRATLATQDLSIDFMAGAVVHTTGNAKTGVKQVRRDRLPDGHRRCFQDLGSAADYRPL